MPSLPPVAARSMSNGTLVHPAATHRSLEPTLPRNGTNSAQLPRLPSAAGSLAGVASPDILPLLQSISSRLQRTDDRIAKMESTLDARLQDAVRSASATASASPATAATGSAPAEAAGRNARTEGRPGGMDGADDEAPGPVSIQAANGGMMISPFANGPGTQSRHHRRLSDPGGPTREITHPGDWLPASVLCFGTCKERYCSVLAEVETELQCWQS